MSRILNFGYDLNDHQKINQKKYGKMKREKIFLNTKIMEKNEVGDFHPRWWWSNVEGRDESFSAIPTRIDDST